MSHQIKYKRNTIIQILCKYQSYHYLNKKRFMQTRIDWTTGGLQFYDADPPKAQRKQDFESNDDINKDFDPKPSMLSIQQRIQLIKSVGQQVLNGDLLRQRMQQKQFLRCYDGFEPSGRMHIAQGLLRAINVNKMVDAGCIFIFWVADYFAMLNGKFDGDLQKIRTVGRYFVEVWKAVGMKTENVKFIWASQQINKRSNEYWLKVMEIACKNSIGRIQKCATIMGKNQNDNLKVSQLFYPCMQCTDVFFLDLDICQLGIDQRKVNTLATEMAPSQKQKPIIVSHGMILGLLEGQQKMSKSDPNSAVFMEDTVKDVQKKIKQAFCPPSITDNNKLTQFCKNHVFKWEKKTVQIVRTQEKGGNKTYSTLQELEQDIKNGVLELEDLKTAVFKILVDENPILDYCRSIIFRCREEMAILRKPQNGGDKVYKSYAEMEKDYLDGNLHPGDIKPAVTKIINDLIEPVRKHFQTNPQAKALLNKILLFKKQADEKKEKQKKQAEKKQTQKLEE